MRVPKSFKMHGLPTFYGLILFLTIRGKCMICTSMERKFFLLTPKLNNFLKHVGRHSWCWCRFLFYEQKTWCISGMNGFILLVICLYFGPCPICNAISNHKKKYVQFATFYHILFHDCLMTKFEGFKALFQLLKIKNIKRKY